MGETYTTVETAEAALLQALPPVRLGRHPREIDRLWLDMFQRQGHFSAQQERELSQLRQQFKHLLRP